MGIVADGVLKEDHLLLVDHWLSFFMVTNLPAFQTVVTECMGVEWNSKSFSKIVITEHETRGLDGRGSFFDNVGQVRDLIQSHLLQVTALLLVTPDDNGSKAKLEVLEDLSVRTCSHGQYDGFLLEPKLGYHKNFADATFSTMYLDMNMDKWNETNLEITTGKSMGTTLYTIAMYQAGGPGLLTIDIGAEEVGVADIKVADWPLENGECSFKAPMPGLEKENEVDMTSSVSDEGTGVIVEYDMDSLYFPKPYAVMVTRMLSKDHGSGFVTFPEVVVILHLKYATLMILYKICTMLSTHVRLITMLNGNVLTFTKTSVDLTGIHPNVLIGVLQPQIVLMTVMAVVFPTIAHTMHRLPTLSLPMLRLLRAARMIMLSQVMITWIQNPTASMNLMIAARMIIHMITRILVQLSLTLPVILMDLTHFVDS